MNNKLIIVALVSLLAGGFGGYQISMNNNQSPLPSGLLGAITIPSQSTTTHGTALQSSLLFQWQSNVVDSLSNVRAPLANLRTAAVASNFMSLASSGAAVSVGAPNSTTTAITVAQAAIGDWCLAQLSSNTSTEPLLISCSVQAASTTRVTISNVSTGTISIATGTWRIAVFPSSTFAAPASLDVTTTTTPYNN